ncbi:FAD-dependent oxidoreductase [Streptomyces ipomoeae]|uniref:FAD dependent oxidoreductase n=1 Tax=Streptomyces ipomoeae 91-03 TaxID=698759 RepID=L1KZE4_9ACTN|nr:FAD-dependent oxidoreductase [Streptomyces ipomoeae]EKX65830.1 hypothetical protein STRIP9103_00869 [Streptomyces ipomoeae 91-03]
MAVLGGGVAGLTAAHELAERGFRVTVYEREALGGKARSMDVPGSGTGGHGPLPGEHGFRFIPGIHHNLPDTIWIDPWVTYLKSLGVEFHIGWTVRDPTLDAGRIAGAVVEDPEGARRTVTADHCISAMPVEHARRTWNSAVRAADPNRPSATGWRRTG